MKPLRPFALTLGAALAALACHGAALARTPVTPPPAPFALVQQLAVDGVAEIVAATPDGMTLVYTSADAGTLGVVDIANPDQARSLPSVNVRIDGVGEPTSVAISPDGRYAVVAVRMGDDATHDQAGLLRVYDILRPCAVRHVKDIAVGIGPDSLALAGQGRTLRAVVAIEDEETNDKGDATLGGQRPGRVDVVGLEDLYGGVSSGVQSIPLVQALQAASGVLYPDDPQPEFVSIDPKGWRAVVSLQENNAVAFIDLSHPRRARLEKLVSVGTVQREGNADLSKNKDIAFTETLTARREPDAVAWVDSEVFAMANEGDGKKSPEGVWPGGRGFTLMDRQGRVVYESGATGEVRAAQYGHYPDSRSAAKGVEMEAVAVARFGAHRYLMVGSERGSFVEVHEIDRPQAPRFVQLLPTGLSPEGLTAVTRRSDGQQLLVTANEGDGSLNLYRFHAQGAPASAREPQIVAREPGMAWGALSGLSTDGQYLYAVPDNAFAPSRIFRIDPVALTQGRMTIDQVIPLTDAGGAALSLDPEGIVRVADGFWIASEGANVEGNVLVKVDTNGRLQQKIALPAQVQALFASLKTGTGFEGVTASADGQTLYMAVQRGYDPARPQAALLRLHLPTQTWTSALYPLDQHSRDPKAYWTGLSEIQLTEDGRLLLLERDKGGGEGRAINAEIKRVYSVKVDDFAEGALLTKTLVRDLRKDHQWLHEKAEGMVVFGGDLWVVNDNDGAGWTRMLNAGKP